MGIRGLTTFIENRSHLYMENYELHDTNLVIDGNSVACQLYKWHTSSYDCFGGDYDKFGKAINDFFELLTQCNVIPYVILDGGYEQRKVNTVVSRMRQKIKSSNKLNTVTESSISVFPLLIIKTFMDIVFQRGIKRVRCDFEGDTDTANIAKALKCPVLSYDSDYFIFDVLYIPFSTLEMSIKRKKPNKIENGYKYIQCKMYRVENFLKSFDGLQKTSLPVLAVLLGNDYVKRGVFTMFYNNLKIQKCHGNQSEQQKKIKSLLIWLQNETVESALKKVLSRYKKARRKIVQYKIQQAIKGYNSSGSKYLKYLGIELKVEEKTKLEIDFVKVNNEDEKGSESENEGSESENEGSESENEDEEPESEDGHLSDEEILFDEDVKLDIPTKFLEKFRKCMYPPSFINILTEHKYYCSPQIENNALEHSHKISFDILSAIHKILNSSEEHLLCIGRKGAEHVGKEKIAVCNIIVPKYGEIEALSEVDKKNYIFKILDIDNNYNDCLNSFPKEWHVFLLTINYFLKKSLVGWPLVYSLIISKLILDCVDTKVGSLYRSSKTFLKKFGTFKTNSSELTFNSTNVQSALEHTSKNDCIACLKTLISYFEMDYKMTTSYKNFDRGLVHLISEFQSCLVHVDHLNLLFDFPLSSVCISSSLNCTFVYNMGKNLNKRTNLDEYVKLLLKDSPSVLYTVNLIINTLKDFINIDVPQQVASKRRKKKRTAKEVALELEIVEPDSDGDDPFDPNNKFTLLRMC